MPDEHLKGVTVGKAHVTSKTSELIFFEFLPKSWLPRKQDPDFHIDYKVEVTESGELTGVNFGVQLKGWTPRKNRNKGPSYSLSSKHLRYYVEKCTIPIFLVLVDVVSKRCYWKFVQQHAKDQLGGSKAKTQKSVAISFLENDVLTVEKLPDVVYRAQQYVRELHPGSVQAAILHQKALLQAKYPQFAVDVDFVAGGMHLHAHPTQDLSLTLKLPTLSHSNAFKEFFEKGKTFTFASPALQITGSPLIDDLVHGKAGIVRLLKKPIAEGQAIISWTDAVAKRDRSIFISGEFRKGDKFITFQGALVGAPLSLEIWFAPGSLEEGRTPAGGFSFDLRVWHGKNVATLPHFESICNLLEVMQCGSTLVFELVAEGNSLGEANFKEPDPNRLVSLCELLNLLKRARTIARHFTIDAVLPTRISPEHCIWIEEVHDLVTKNRHEYKAVGGGFTLIMDHQTSLEDYMGRVISMDAKLDKTYSLFETPFCIGPLQETMTNVKITKVARNENEAEIACSLSADSYVTLSALETPIRKQPLSQQTNRG